MPTNKQVDAQAPGPAPGTAGPHRHDILNKLDPTVDAQSGGAQILGPGAQHRPQETPAMPFGHSQAATNTHMPQRQQGFGAPYEEQIQPQHSSRLANALDPRVDSNRPHASSAAPGISAPAMTQSHASARQPAAVHPRHEGSVAGGQQPLQGQAGIPPEHTTMSGPAPNTAGPHRSDVLNKLDPTVRSNISNRQV